MKTLICTAKQTSKATGLPMNRFVPVPDALATVPTKSISLRGVGHRFVDGVELEKLKLVCLLVDQVSEQISDGAQLSCFPDPPVIRRWLQPLSSTGPVGLLDIELHVSARCGAAEAV
jgi:hypothetical protein